jgi:peptidoglycan hydrolase CwlO-like protein
MSLSVEIIASRLFDQLLRMYGLDGFAKILRPERTIDERLTKLTKIQEDLGDAMKAVAELQKSATTAKKEADELESEVGRLRQDRAVAEEMVKVPEEAFGRLLARASAKGRGRGLLEGIVVGLLTGGLSSWVVWYFTRPA